VLVLIESANPCSIKHVNKYIVLLVERGKGKVDVSCQGLTRENVGSTSAMLFGVGSESSGDVKMHSNVVQICEGCTVLYISTVVVCCNNIFLL
jgi:hypothetical protein